MIRALLLRRHHGSLVDASSSTMFQIKEARLLAPDVKLL
jgi:hypothetical protein